MSQENCPDCAVVPGQAHERGCDVERCVLCGYQALGHDILTRGGKVRCENTGERIPEQRGIWTGEWPGVVECREFGWYSRWTIVTEYSPDGRPDSGPSVLCEPGHPHAHEDLNRLQIALRTGEVVWSRKLERCVLMAEVVS